ncbi:amidase [Roseovarius aestuarii]|uniref:Glutamyl-tRNA(Gln) amidotransferase subunit A n=1 Tax=Roseovarius aestuarii TaxID=475083 RepID=A0A1X7BN25_9RHOB|nr:amidase [Roseovarius aestuarii]SMC11001.1 Glutamyl-tRNA(Gln) amidotransferase subunit A [Roseovarius aestuarii]
MKGELYKLSAVDAAQAIRDGRLSSEALVQSCLDQIAATNGVIKAWACLDPELALVQAREMDRIRRSGKATGALHGVPVGLKDIIDTRFMPTECGSEIFAGRVPEGDASIVNRLREAGAVIMGKLSTAEFAYLHPTDTTNPHNAAHTPGGSSSGSAAAVAAHHVPLAVGTQTGGSIIRPASFCGTYGAKPTRGLIPRTGLFRTSATLDQVGGFANTLEDLALLIDVLGCYDPADSDSFARPRPSLLDGARAQAPVEPDIAWFDLPFHDRLSPDAAAGLEVVIEALGPRVERFPTAPQLAELVSVHKTIYDYEIARQMTPIATEHGDRISSEMREAITRGYAISDDQYQDALGVKASANAFFTDHFNDFDAIMAPSASGEALPLSAGNTGDAVYCTIWTLAGLPCLTLPMLVGEAGLPIGVQLIGAVEEDDRLTRTAAWVQRALADDAE